MQLVDGKAVMVSDLYCDGLGACIGECPTGAITFEEREAVPYDEVAVMQRLIPKGEKAIRAHLQHLKEHGEAEWVRQGMEYLQKQGIEIGLCGCDTVAPPDQPAPAVAPLACGCPGTMAREIRRPVVMGGGTAGTPAESSVNTVPSELRQFPVQLHLINPAAGFFQGADLLLAADCTAFALGDFHRKVLKGKMLAIACPKLDTNIPAYVEKLIQLIDQAQINTLTVAIMEVPCCGGLLRVAQEARSKAGRHIPLKQVVISTGGEILEETWL